MNDKPLCLLALDGGGIRGLSELVVLEEIMNRIKYDLGVPEDEHLLPAEFFDLIGGTSTGGLIALLLGRLHRSVPQARREYVRIAEEVFSLPRYLKKSTFDGQKLEKGVKRLLGNDRSEEKMLEKDGSCKVFVCAVPQQDVKARAGPRLFRTYRVRENPSYNCTIWEACRATSAAPSYFESIKIGDDGEQETFVDGGLGYNNPVEQVLGEARRIFPGRKVACVVSIGTGVASAIAFPDSPKTSLVHLIKALKNMATESDTMAEKTHRRFQNVKDTYFRFSVDRGLQGVGLEEWKQLPNVRTFTTEYLNQHRPRYNDEFARYGEQIEQLQEKIDLTLQQASNQFAITRLAEIKSLLDHPDVNTLNELTSFASSLNDVFRVKRIQPFNPEVVFSRPSFRAWRDATQSDPSSFLLVHCHTVAPHNTSLSWASHICVEMVRWLQADNAILAWHLCSASDVYYRVRMEFGDPAPAALAVISLGYRLLDMSSAGRVALGSHTPEAKARFDTLRDCAISARKRLTAYKNAMDEVNLMDCSRAAMAFLRASIATFSQRRLAPLPSPNPVIVYLVVDRFDVLPQNDIALLRPLMELVQNPESGTAVKVLVVGELELWDQEGVDGVAEFVGDCKRKECFVVEEIDQAS
ncbi:hypothetical protein PoHVEF18_009373 [Penicillium ochrochloron]